jgi:HlyD family secretion protein
MGPVMAASTEAPSLSAPRRRRPLSELVEREKARARRRRLALAAVLVLFVVAVVAASIALRPRPIPLGARFRVQPVTRGDVVREVRATGHLEAVTTVQVGAEISGRIAFVDVDFNDVVKEGQVLARFDRVALDAQLAQTTASLAAAKAAFEQAKTERDHLARDLARVERLWTARSVSDADRDDAMAAAKQAEQRVAAAEAQVASQQASFTVSRNNLDHAVIRAPIAGVVITRNVDPGQTVASMFQTPVLFTVAADLRKMRVVAAVDEADIGEVEPRQRATFTVNAFADRVFEGVVTEVRNSPVVVQDVVTYGTVVEVENLDLALRPGMTATVRVRTASVKDALRVPTAALHFAPPGEKTSEHAGLWLLDAGALHRVDVAPGITDGETSAIDRGAVVEGREVLVELSPEGRKAYGIAH